MAGRVAGKVAFITGAARGQGRAHAGICTIQSWDEVTPQVWQDTRYVTGLEFTVDAGNTIR